MKKLLVYIPLILAGCTNSVENYFNAKGNIVSLDSWSCNYAKNHYSIGLVFTEYQSKENKVKISGVSNGIVVNNYIAGSPADLAVLPLAVSIVRANSQDITSGNQFISLINSLPNSNIEIEYIGKHASGKKILKTTTGSAYMNNCKYRYRYKNGEYMESA